MTYQKIPGLIKGNLEKVHGKMLSNSTTVFNNEGEWPLTNRQLKINMKKATCG